MPYVYLDQLAMGNDHAWSSFQLLRWRDNVAQIQTERFYKAAISYPTDSEPFWCSADPTAWGRYWIFLPGAAKQSWPVLQGFPGRSEKVLYDVAGCLAIVPDAVAGGRVID